MSLTLAQYRTRILELLDDQNSTRYSTAQIDTAIRAALIDYSTIRPVKRTYQLEATGNKVLSLPDLQIMQITRLQLWNDDPNQILELPFNSRLVDETWSIETIHYIYPAGNIFTVTYTTPHTIDGLDSAAGTTIDDDNLLCLGAAGYAAQSRAVSRSETINLEPNVQKALKDLSTQFFTRFFMRLPQGSVIAFEAFQMPKD